MTGSARDQILARIRAANRAAARPTATRRPASSADADADAAYAALSRRYLRAHHDPAGHDIAALFAERAADYRAVVERVPEAGLAAAIARVLAARSAAAPGPFVVPAGSPPDGWPNCPARSRWPATSPRFPQPNSTG